MNYNEALRLVARLGENSVFVIDEENTKRVIIEPIIEQILGYQIPYDVTLENIADIGVKSGEKVDYAIKVNGVIKILVEAKDLREDIGDKEYITQLYRYYAATGAEVGIITNGVDWRIYTDTAKANIMDLEPIYSFSLKNYTEQAHEVLSSISKGVYSSEYLRALSDNKKSVEQSDIAKLETEYEAVQAINDYINSEQFLKDIEFRCKLSLYPEDKLKEMVKSVLSGSYVLKYARVEQAKKNKRGINLIDAYNSPELLQGRVINKVFYTCSNREQALRDIKELPYVVLNLIKTTISYSMFEEVMSKQAGVKKWICPRDYNNVVEIGVQTINGYDIYNAKTDKEALKRSMQLIKVFKINPIWFLLGEE